MKIQIRYFGQLGEITGKSEEHLEVSCQTIAELRVILIAHYSGLDAIHFKIAQDNSITADSSPLKGQLIDLLPPFSGG